jgi:glucokinase
VTANPDAAVLVADIGGTHVRFALSTAAGRLGDRQTFDCADFESPALAAESFLSGLQLGERPRVACFAVAARIGAARVETTNQVWRCSAEEPRRQLELDRLEVVNDFTAVALSIPTLGDEDRRRIKQGEGRAGLPLAVLGPGTGLGVSALIPQPGGWLALAGEGGHRGLAPPTEREWQVVELLQRRCGHVSAERVLSGPGLVVLYQAISLLSGVEARKLEPGGVAAEAKRDPEGPAGEAMTLFAGWLGGVAGDLVLTLGARGGVYLAGGVLPRLGDVFDEERFRTRFMAKGRFRSYLEPVPVDLIVSEEATLRGAANHLISLGNSTTIREGTR